MKIVKKYFEYDYVFHTQEDLIEQIRIDISSNRELGENTKITQVFPQDETIYNITNDETFIQVELYPLDENIVVEVLN